MTTPPKKDVITIALSKGYLLEEAMKLFGQIGLFFDDDLATSRKLFTHDTTGRFRILQIRPWDVPVYVEQGAADFGIAGKDVLYERQSKVIQLMDMKYGECKLVLAGPKVQPVSSLKHNLKVATKYPHCTEAYFQKLGLKINMIKLYGAVELAPLTGLSDVICDLTASGKTLKENHLHIIETMFESSAYLIANPVSFKFYSDEIRDLIDRLNPIL